MQPDITKITIHNNINQILGLLQDLVFMPRLNAITWSNITKQTPSLKIGYPGQHLASLITGMEGERTAARGNDICDGTEIKSCNRVDQLDTCKNCNGKVMRIEMYCPHCGSNNIKRAKDSKWLFGVKNANDLYVLTEQTNRVLFILFDYPNFHNNDFNTIQIQAFEVWNNSPRCSNFRELMTRYYNDIFQFHIGINPNKTPAPYNMWPDLFPFFQCNPIKVFDCIVYNSNTNPQFETIGYIEPHINRDNFPSIIAPINILNVDELRLLSNASDNELIPLINPGYNIHNLRDIFLIENDTTFKREITQGMFGVDEILRHYIPLRTMREPRETGVQVRGARN